MIYMYAITLYIHKEGVLQPRVNCLTLTFGMQATSPVAHAPLNLNNLIKLFIIHCYLAPPTESCLHCPYMVMTSVPKIWGGETHTEYAYYFHFDFLQATLPQEQEPPLLMWDQQAGEVTTVSWIRGLWLNCTGNVPCHSAQIIPTRIRTSTFGSQG